MPTDINKLVTKNRKQYLSNRHIYEAMIKLNKTPLNDLLIKPDARKIQIDIISQVSLIIHMANEAIEKGYDIPKVLNKIIINEMSNFIVGESHGIGWAVQELRDNGVKIQNIAKDPKSTSFDTTYITTVTTGIFKGFVDAKALKSGELTLEKMDNKTYRRRKSGTGYHHGFTIGETKNVLFLNEFLIYIQQKMLINASVGDEKYVTLDTIRKALDTQELLSGIQELVKLAKNDKYEPNGNLLMF